MHERGHDLPGRAAVRADPTKAEDFTRCAAQMAAALEVRGVRLFRVELPTLPDSVKTGLDDYFFSGRSNG